MRWSRWCRITRRATSSETRAWGSAPCTAVLRAYRLALLRYDPELARSLDEALGGAQQEAGRHGYSPAKQAAPAAEVARSLTGALARMPDDDLAALVALLETATTGRLVRYLAEGTRRPEAAARRLEADWHRHASALETPHGVALRARYLQALRSRVNGRQAVTGLEGLASELVETLGPAFGVPETLPIPQRFQSILCAAAHQALGNGLEPSVRRLARETLRGAAWESGLVAAASVAVGLARRRLALTLATLVYVLGSGLLGITMAFDVYRWIALTIEALAHPGALAAYTAGGASLVALRHRRRLDLHLAAWTLAALYRGLPVSGRA